MTISLQDQLVQLHETYHVIALIKCDYDDPSTAKLDLYQRLHAVYREQYQPNQRIIIILDSDFYSPLNPDTGQIMAAIQNLVQQIDISNFFVCLLSTNPDVEKEYRIVFETHSIDPVPITIYPCHGDWKKTMTDQESFVGKMDIPYELNSSVSSLPPQELDKLFNQKHFFCMMPWVGMHVATTSGVAPCCEYDAGRTMGNAKSQQLEDIWNSTDWKQLRQDMLAGRVPSGCTGCLRKEATGKDSLRHSTNRSFAHRVTDTKQTTADGHHPLFQLGYLDIRYNNLCNLTCRSCNPESSSSWVSLHNHINPDKKITDIMLETAGDQDAMYAEIMPHLATVEKIYFAGGEPMMIENFYKILLFLIEQGRTDVHLVYNINLTRLQLKHYNILDLWPAFRHVSVGASLDGMESRGEYIRQGSDWSQIEQHARMIKTHCPHVDFWVTAVAGLINALHLPDFHKDWVDRGLLRPEDFAVQMLYSPEWLSLTSAPALLRAQVVRRYTDHLRWLAPLDRLGRAKSGFQSAIMLCQQPSRFDRDIFWNRINEMDQFFGTDLFDRFPELQGLGF